MENIQNKEISIEEYLSYDNEEKLEYLLNYWKFEDNLFYGELPINFYGANYAFVREFNHIKKGRVCNPFTGTSIDNIFCLLRSIPKKRNIEEGDLIIFSICANEKEEDIRNGKIIKVDEKTVNKLENDVLKKKEELIREIDELNDERDKLNSEVEEIKIKSTEKINNFKDEINLMETIHKEISNIICEVEKKQSKYLKLGLIEKNISIDKKRKVTSMTNDEKIQYIYEYLYKRENKPLLYKKEVIEQFFVGLNTNQLIVLGGAPGSGKTSLVEGVAEAIGAECKMIYVRPNWNSAEDLLGFYNSIDKLFIGTPMIDAIIEANNNPEDIYFICLDEMNLGYLELYFSDFLSALYTENREIQLYSKEIYSSELEYIENMIGDLENKDEIIKSIGLEEYIQLSKRYKNLNKYKPVINIPENIRFIGTINRDATTKDLSPKVIDRSIIININSSFDTFEELIKLKETSVSMESIFISSEEIKPLKGDVNSAYYEFKDIIKLFNDNDIELNFRFLNTAANMLSIEGIKKESLIDYIIATKILPKLNMEISEDSNILNRLDELIEGEVSKKIYEEMKSFYKYNEILTYWR